MWSSVKYFPAPNSPRWWRKPANSRHFALLCASMVVTYIKLFRTGADRHNDISFLLLVAETIRIQRSHVQMLIHETACFSIKKCFKPISTVPFAFYLWSVKNNSVGRQCSSYIKIGKNRFSFAFNRYMVYCNTQTISLYHRILLIPKLFASPWYEHFNPLQSFFLYFIGLSNKNHCHNLVRENCSRAIEDTIIGKEGRNFVFKVLK